MKLQIQLKSSHDKIIFLSEVYTDETEIKTVMENIDNVLEYRRTGSTPIHDVNGNKTFIPNSMILGSILTFVERD